MNITRLCPLLLSNGHDPRSCSKCCAHCQYQGGGAWNHHVKCPRFREPTLAEIRQAMGRAPEDSMRPSLKGGTWTVVPKFYRVRFLDADGGLLAEHSLHAVTVEHAYMIAWNDAEPETLERTRRLDVREQEKEE